MPGEQAGKTCYNDTGVEHLKKTPVSLPRVFSSVLTLSLLLLSLLFAGPVTLVRAEGGLAGPRQIANYTIQPGDTFYRIAHRFGTTVARLQAINLGVNQDALRAGQVIQVDVLAPKLDAKVYTVKAGDTPRKIAGEYGVTVEALMRENHVTDPTQLWIGQQLLIPRTGAVKLGPTAMDINELKAFQNAVNSGKDPWRLNPVEVAQKEGPQFGFKDTDGFTLVSFTEKGKNSGAGEAVVRARHQGVYYQIQLIQPVYHGQGGIWTITNITREQ